MAEPTINNFVVTTYLSDYFDLYYIDSNLPGGDYRPEVFPGLTYVLENPKCAVLLLTNGRVAVTGCKTMEDAQSALEYVVQLLSSIGVSAYYNTDIKILNIVGSMDITKEVDLYSFFKILNTTKAEFEPERFPGIIYHMGDGIDMLIFKSGKVVLTGAKTMENFNTSAEIGAELVEGILAEGEAD